MIYATKRLFEAPIFRTITLSLLLMPIADTAYSRCLTTISTADDVKAKMDQALSAGCSVFFEPGEHSTTSRLGYEFVGTPADPIVIYGNSPLTTRLSRPDANQNLMDLSGSHFVVKGLELEGGSVGLRLEGAVSNAYFSDLIIHDTEGSSFTANSAGQSYTEITVRQTELYNTGGTGECLYLGCNSNACTFGNSRIEHNYCHDTQTTLGSSQGEGIDLKGGAFNVHILHNVFRDTAGPGIMTYANAGGVQNIIEGNAVVNPGDVGIQFTGDSVVRNNIVVIADGIETVGINGSADNQGVPNNVQVRNNTVVNTTGDSASDCLAVRGWDDNSANMVIANNALYCAGGTALYMGTGSFENATVSGNAVEGMVPTVPSGTFSGGLAAEQFESINNVNLFPVSDSVLVAAGDVSQSPSHDFNCSIRETSTTDVGAYLFSERGNTGWSGSQTFKYCLPLIFMNGFE